VQWPPPHELIGDHVTLSQFVPDDAPELFAALDHDACWDHVAGRPSSPEEYAATLAQAPQAGRWPWIVRQAGSVVGTTSYLDVSLPDARLEIGSTAYTPSAWASEVNPECKLLLMSWAFDHDFGRVQLKTDIRNLRSQRAIAGLGATQEGVLRRYQRRADGTVRDTVMYAVTAEEWPGVRERLLTRLARV
jgi:N-acetyltransferase